MLCGDCQTKRGERDHEVVTLPSECRQRKDSCLAPWGGNGGRASIFQGLPWGIDTFHSGSPDPSVTGVFCSENPSKIPSSLFFRTWS